MAIHILLLSVVCVVNAGAWDKEEHRLLADSVYHSVMRVCADSPGDTVYVIGEGDSRVALAHRRWNQRTFGEMCAELAADDLARNRFHERGKTILEQLTPLTVERLAAARHRVMDATTDLSQLVQSQTLSSENVIIAFLLYHLIALRLADQAGQAGQDGLDRLAEALVMEAAAQGYLADAFSAGHILTPRHEPLASLQRRNIIEAHNFHRNRGVYVVNARGDAWQTFGDRLMHWYAPGYRAVLEAGRYSLRELLTVYCHHGGLPDSLQSWLDGVDGDRPVDEIVSSWLSECVGVEYYTTVRMPTLMLLPMPVAATWSFRTQTRDEHGIRRLHHFPQLRDDGFHDPDLVEADRNFLYPQSTVPDWMIPPPLRQPDSMDPRELIKEDADYASVLWTQNRHVPPSFKGCLIILGGQLTFEGSRHRYGGQLGVGYGLWDDLMLLKNVSAEVGVLTAAGESDRLMLIPSFGAGLPIGFGPIKAMRLEGGVATDLRSRYGDVGGMVAAGFDSKSLPLGFTYAGVTLRLKYQLLFLNRTLHGPSLQLILH